MSKPLVVIEAPYAAKTRVERKRNDAYLAAAMRDSFSRGEAPFSSAKLYADGAIADDNDPTQRALGIEAGLLWAAKASLTACYVDNGITEGVRKGIARAEAEGRSVVYRRVEGWTWPPSKT